MPTISMFYADHAPPHIHVQYAEFKSIIDIKQLEIVTGELPRKALELVLEWTELHQAELLIDWELCQKNLAPNKVEPLK